MPKPPPDDADPTVRGRRPGSMSGEDRDLEALKRRRVATPPHGVLVAPGVLELLGELTQLEQDLDAEADEFDEQFTPVKEVLALAQSTNEQAIVLALWRHTANQELRFRRTRNRSSEGQMRKELDELRDRVVDLSGKDGTNGKVGETRRRVDGLFKGAWWGATLLVGSIGTLVVKVILVVRTFDAVEARAEHNSQALLEMQARVLRLETEALRRHRFQPAEEPDRKDTSP